MKGLRIDLATKACWNNTGKISDDEALLFYFHSCYKKAKDREKAMSYYRHLILPLTRVERLMTKIPWRQGLKLYLAEVDYFLVRHGASEDETEELIRYMVDKLGWRYYKNNQIIVGRVWDDDT